MSEAETFCPERCMEPPFRALLEASQKCADQGFLVFIRPDKSDGKWSQELFILPADAMLAARDAS